MIELLTGAGIAWVSLFIGWLIGRRNRIRPSKPIKPICGCGHHLSYHGHDGVCGSMREIATKYNIYGDPVAFSEILCGCKKYVLRDDPMAAVGGYDIFPLPPPERKD